MYRLAGAPTSPEQAILAAVFAAGPDAAASHRSAGALWALPGVTTDAAEVVVPYGAAPKLRGVRVHRSRTLEAGDVTRLGPIPLTTPARTVVDLAGVLDATSLEDVLDDALRRRLVTPRKFAALVPAAGNGVDGIAVLRGLLAVRATGHLGESGFENRLRRLLLSAGLPVPAAQYVVRDEHRRFIARVDLAFPDHKLAIEADGFGPHSGRRAFERDRSRQNALTNAGWRILRVTTVMLDREPWCVVDVVRKALL